MKKIFTKKSVIRFSLFTLSLFTTPALAQDAFYIYRNDGEFDGFFYDDVIRMGYSKIDPNGVEHDEYVIQEIETEDSLYRIPLCVIDSIGFQQPEVIFNPRLVNMDETGLTQYVENTHDNKLFLSKNTPSELLPKEGDVLVSFGTDIQNDQLRNNLNFGEDHEYGGFGGKVVKVQHFPQYGFIQVDYDNLTQISDVFQQLIAVEQVGYDEQGNVKRRISGFDYDEKMHRWVRKAKEGGFGFNLIDFSGSLHHDFGNSNINLGVKLKVALDMTYNISWSRIYFKLGRSFGVSLKPGATLKTSSDFDYEISGIPRVLESIKFPAVAPIFQTRPLPKAFIRGGGELAANLTLPELGFNYHESVSYDSDLFFPWRFRMFDEGPKEGSLEYDTPFNTGDIELKLSGFVQTGIKFKANIETNDWFSDILQSDISMDIYVGPKIEGTAALSAATIASGGAYDTMKGWKIIFTPISIDLALKASAKLFWADPVETTFFEGALSFFPVNWKAVSDFDSLKVAYNPKRELIDAALYPSGKTFLMNYIGVGLYDYQMNLIADQMATTPYFLTQTSTFKEWKAQLSTSGLKCGRYYVRPRLKLFGYDINVQKPMQEIIVTPTLSIDKDSVEVTGETHQLQFYVKTNAEEVNVDFFDKENKPITADYFWAKGSLSEIDQNNGTAVLTVNVDENSTLWNREGYIMLTAVTDEFSTCDSVLIKQASDFKGFKKVIGSIGLNAHQRGTVYRSGYGELNDGTETIDNDASSVYVPFLSHDDYSGQDVPITFSRSGNIMTVKGFLSTPFEDSGKTTLGDGKSYMSYSSSGSVTINWEIVLDLSKPSVAEFVSASGKYAYSGTKTSHEESWLFVGSSSEYLRETKDADYNEQNNYEASCALKAIGEIRGNKLIFRLINSSEQDSSVTFDQASGHGESHSNNTVRTIEYKSNGNVDNDITQTDKGDSSTTPYGDKTGRVEIEMTFE